MAMLSLKITPGAVAHPIKTQRKRMRTQDCHLWTEWACRCWWGEVDLSWRPVAAAPRWERGGGGGEQVQLSKLFNPSVQTPSQLVHLLFLPAQFVLHLLLLGVVSQPLVLQLHLELLDLPLQLVLHCPVTSTQLVKIRTSPPHLVLSLFQLLLFNLDYPSLAIPETKKSSSMDSKTTTLTLDRFLFSNSSSSFRSFCLSNSFSRRWSSAQEMNKHSLSHTAGMQYAYCITLQVLCSIV